MCYFELKDSPTVEKLGAVRTELPNTLYPAYGHTKDGSPITRMRVNANVGLHLKFVGGVLEVAAIGIKLHR